MGVVTVNALVTEKAATTHGQAVGRATTMVSGTLRLPVVSAWMVVAATPAQSAEPCDSVLTTDLHLERWSVPEAQHQRPALSAERLPSRYTLRLGFVLAGIRGDCRQKDRKQRTPENRGQQRHTLTEQSALMILGSGYTRAGA